MPISESMVQEIVQEVMAKMQIADAPAGKHGIFKEMNDAIEAAKKADQSFAKCPWTREKKFLHPYVRRSEKTLKFWHVWALTKPEWEMWATRS